MTHYKADFTPKIALYEPDIPQNTAAIIRTCACLGAQLEIIEPCGFLLSDKRFKRVVMDYINIKNINKSDIALSKLFDFVNPITSTKMALFKFDLNIA